jgi:methylthioribose-1-phosphate isomerase
MFSHSRKAIHKMAVRAAELIANAATFEAAVAHVTEDGKTKRSVSSSDGWAMVHKDRLTELEILEEAHNG